MQDKSYRTKVETVSDDADIPKLAVFSIGEAMAREIAKLAALVKEHDLLVLEQFASGPTYYRRAYANDDDDIVSTDVDTVVVMEKEFWFSACLLGRSHIDVSTERQSIPDLLSHFGIGAPANTSANDEIPVGTPGKLVTLDGVEIQGTLETVNGVAGIVSAVRNEDGSIDYDYSGDTKIWWDEQKTVETATGEIIFITEDGDAVPASQVKLISAD